MEIAEIALETLRESQTTSEENNFMHTYSTMLVEVSKMREELTTHAGALSPEVYDKKEKRVESLESSLILFNQCFFKLMFYKQEMVTWKKKFLDKELEFITFVTKHLDNEQRGRRSN